jgi:hypothetical protein
MNAYILPRQKGKKSSFVRSKRQFFLKKERNCNPKSTPPPIINMNSPEFE